MPLFDPTPFTSHSSLRLPFKIDCDALSDADLDCLARVYAETKKDRWEFGEVVGVPRGGLRLAEALGRHLTINGNVTWAPNLIVDDVLTTGASMREFWRQRYPARFSSIYGLVIFARGPCPAWVTPLFQLNPAFA